MKIKSLILAAVLFGGGVATTTAAWTVNNNKEETTNSKDNDSDKTEEAYPQTRGNVDAFLGPEEVNNWNLRQASDGTMFIEITARAEIWDGYEGGRPDIGDVRFSDNSGSSFSDSNPGTWALSKANGDYSKDAWWEYRGIKDDKYEYFFSIHLKDSKYTLNRVKNTYWKLSWTTWPSQGAPTLNRYYSKGKWGKDFNSGVDVSPPRQISSSNISFSKKSVGNNNKNVTFSYNVNLPSHNSSYEDTKVSQVTLFDNGSEVTNNISYSNRSSASGTISVSNLSGTNHNFTLKVKTNAGSGLVASKSISHSLNHPRRIQKDDLVTFKVTSVNSSTAHVEYKINVGPLGENETMPVLSDLILIYQTTGSLIYKHLSVPSAHMEGNDVVFSGSQNFNYEGYVANSSQKGKYVNYHLDYEQKGYGDDWVKFDKETNCQIEKYSAKALSASDVTFTSSDVTEHTAKLNFSVKTNSNSAYKDTTIEKVTLLDLEDNEIQSIENKKSGSFDVSELYSNSKYSYKLKVESNVNTITIDPIDVFTLSQGNGKPISNDDLEVTYIENSDSIDFDYNVTLPELSMDYDATNIIKVEVINVDEDSVVATNKSGEAIDTITVSDLTPNKTYNFKIRVTTDAVNSDGSDNIIESDSMEITTKSLDSLPITEDDVEFEEVGVTDKTASLHYEVNLPTDPTHESTTIDNIRLTQTDDDGNEEIVGETTEAKGDVDVIDLNPNTEYHFDLDVETNAANDDGSANIIHKELDVTTSKGGAIPITNDDIKQFEIVEGTVTDTSVMFNYEIELPIQTNPDLDETKINKIELINDIDDSIVDTVFEPASSGIFVIVDNLKPDTDYAFKIKVYTNALESDGVTPNVIESDVLDTIHTNKTPAEPITADDITFEVKEDSITQDSATFTYNVDLPSDLDHEKTNIKKIELINAADDSIVETSLLPDSSGEIEVKDLNVNSEYSYKLRVATNAKEEDNSENIVETDAINIKTLMGEAKGIESVNAELKDIDSSNVATIDYDINLIDSDENYEETVINEVSLVKIDESTGDETVIKTNTDGSLTGEFKTSELPLNSDHTYKIKATSNANDEVYSDEINVHIDKGDALPIDEDKIIFEQVGEPTATSVEFSYDITLPDNEDYDDTIVNKILIKDQNDIEYDSTYVFDHTNKHLTGTLSASGLTPNTNYEFRLVINAANVASVETDPISVTTLKLAAPISRDNIEFDINEITSTTISFNYKINFINDVNVESTILEKVELLDRDEVLATSIDEEGTISAKNLAPNTSHRFKLRVTTNGGITETDEIVANTQIYDNDLETSNFNNLRFDVDNSQMLFDLYVEGNEDDFKVKYDEKDLKVKSKTHQATSVRGDNKFVTYSVDLEDGINYNLNNFSVSHDDGYSYENLNYDMLVSNNNFINANGFNFGDDGTIYHNGLNTEVRIIEMNGRIVFEDKDGNVFDEINSNNNNSNLDDSVWRALWTLVLIILLGQSLVLLVKQR